MSPVIRLSDSTYKHLELHAIGFDAPNNVIERLIDFYESHHKNSQKSNSELHETTQVTRPDTTPLSVNKRNGSEREYIKNYQRQLNNPNNLISKIKRYIDNVGSIKRKELKEVCVWEFGYSKNSGSIGASIKALELDGSITIEGRADSSIINSMQE